MILLAQSDARQIPLADESVHCVVTSPPYFGLRDYGIDGQFGLEQTPEEYVANMVAVFREVRRVLRRDGTLWLNIGDSYAGSWGNYAPGGIKGTQRPQTENGKRWERPAYADTKLLPPTANVPGLKPKDLIGIPWMVAFALQADGWWLRSDIVWAKPNPMPESVTDRPTKSHEYVFLLAKAARYYYDAPAIAEPVTLSTIDRLEQPTLAAQIGSTRANGGAKMNGNMKAVGGISTRNRRTVWTVSTRPYRGAHFATFPPALVEPCILAGTSAHGVCAKCGAPYRRVVERTKPYVEPHKIEPQRYEGLGKHKGIDSTATAHTPGWRNRPPEESHTLGWSPSCSCDAPVVPAIVLDPFAGSGTVGRVAIQHRRRAVLLDLNVTYLADLATERTNGVQMEMGYETNPLCIHHHRPQSPRGHQGG